jgi:hypothetical protein
MPPFQALHTEMRHRYRMRRSEAIAAEGFRQSPGTAICRSRPRPGSLAAWRDADGGTWASAAGNQEILSACAGG